jgi:hypothetical protein
MQDQILAKIRALEGKIERVRQALNDAREAQYREDKEDSRYGSRHSQDISRLEEELYRLEQALTHTQDIDRSFERAAQNFEMVRHLEMTLERDIELLRDRVKFCQEQAEAANQLSTLK